MSHQMLELTAKETLTRITGWEDTLKPLYLQPDRALFLAENLGIVLKVYMAGKTLQREYAIARKAASIGVPTAEIIGFEAGPPAVLVMKQVIGEPLSLDKKLAARAAGKYLRCFHSIGADLPFSGGQQDWETFVSRWAVMR